MCQSWQNWETAKGYWFDDEECREFVFFRGEPNYYKPQEMYLEAYTEYTEFEPDEDEYYDYY